MKKSVDSNRFRWQLVLSVGLLVLIRPQLGILPLVGFLYGLLSKHYHLSSGIILAIVPLFLWYVRTGLISNEVPSFHPIYSKTNNHFYRPSHAAMTDLFRIWEWKSDVFHNHSGRIGFGDESSIDDVLNEIPQKYRESVEPLF